MDQMPFVIRVSLSNNDIVFDVAWTPKNEGSAVMHLLWFLLQVAERKTAENVLIIYYYRVVLAYQNYVTICQL